MNIDPIKLIEKLEELQEKIAKKDFSSALTIGAAIAVIEALLEERKKWESDSR